MKERVTGRPVHFPVFFLAMAKSDAGYFVAKNGYVLKPSVKGTSQAT